MFCDTYAVDGFGTVFKLLIVGSAVIGLFAIAAYFHQRPQVAQAPVALAFATLGGVALTSSIDLGLIVLALQILSSASYILVALLRGNQRSNEAMLKFFVYAAVAQRAHATRNRQY